MIRPTCLCREIGPVTLEFSVPMYNISKLAVKCRARSSLKIIAIFTAIPAIPSHIMSLLPTACTYNSADDGRGTKFSK